jgi:hypothetical protein
MTTLLSFSGSSLLIARHWSGAAFTNAFLASIRSRAILLGTGPHPATA